MRNTWLVLASFVVSFAAGCSCSDTSSGAGDTGAHPDAIGSDAPSVDAPGNDAASCPDADGDGVTTCAGDCDDTSALTATGFPEVCGDGADNDCDGTPDDGCTGGLGTFVSAMTGSDTNPGTQAMPVRTIARGMANAVTLGLPQTVVVAEGTYMEKVTLVEGIDLLGGHHCVTGDCTWARDATAYVAEIRNTDFEGVLAPTGITQATLFDGFRVTGQSGGGATPGTAAMTLSGCPTIRGNVIVGGDVNGGGFGADRSFGIRIRPTTDPAGILIENNTITGGMSTNSSAGVGFDWMSASGMTGLATIRGNVISGGSAVHSAGISAWISASGTLVTDNDIFAGPANGGRGHGIEVGSAMTIDGNRINHDGRAGACTSPTGWCAGISSESSTTTITNNVVFGTPGPQSAAILLGEFEVPAGGVILNGNTLDGGGSGPSSSPTRSAAVVVTIGTCTTCGFHGSVGRIRNNILMGGNNASRYGVIEDPSAGRQMHPEQLENNLFFFATATGRTDVLFRQLAASGTPTDQTTIAMVNAVTTPMAAANVAGDPLLDATWHLAAGSPAIDVGTATEAPALDFDAQTRPRGGGFDVGADEL